MSLWLGWCCCTKLWLFGLGWLHTGTCLLSLPVCARLALDNYPKLYNKFFVGLLMMLLLLSWCCSTNYDYLDWDECTLVCVSCHCQRGLVSLLIPGSNPKLYNKFFCWVVDDVTVNWLMLLHQLWLFGLGWLHTGTCLLSLPVCFRLALDSYLKLYNKFFCWVVDDVTVIGLMLLHQLWLFGLGWLHTGMCLLSSPVCFCLLLIIIQNFTM